MRLPWRAAFIAVALVLAGSVQAIPAAQAGGQFVWPAEGRMTQPYGCTGFSWEPRRGSCRHFHSGVDIANKAGTPIRAATSGVVKLVGYNPYDRPGDRAWVVVISHDAGFTGWYAHMQPKYAPGVRAGKRVSAGQVIGYMGNTGRSTGVHLHFSFMRNGEPVNPARYLPSFRSTAKPAAKTAPTEPKPDADAQIQAVDDNETVGQGETDPPATVESTDQPADADGPADGLPLPAGLWNFDFEVLCGEAAVGARV